LREVILPHYLDKRLTDGGKVVSSTCRPPFNPRFIFEDSWYSFLLEAESASEHSAAGRFRYIRKKKSTLLECDPAIFRFVA
jgi:hypothetical protein